MSARLVSRNSNSASSNPEHGGSMPTAAEMALKKKYEEMLAKKSKVAALLPQQCKAQSRKSFNASCCRRPVASPLLVRRPRAQQMAVSKVLQIVQIRRCALNNVMREHDFMAKLLQ